MGSFLKETVKGAENTAFWKEKDYRRNVKNSEHLKGLFLKGGFNGRNVNTPFGTPSRKEAEKIKI
jgi:hypothetical protein